MPPQTDAPGIPSPETSAPPPAKSGKTSARTARVVGIGMMVAGAILLALYYMPPPFSAIVVIALLAAAIFWGRRELSKKSAPK